MGDITVAQLLAYGRDITVTGGLILILVGGWKKWWRWGYQFDELRADMDIRIADLKQQLSDAKAETQEWRGVAWRNIEVLKAHSQSGVIPQPAGSVPPTATGG